MFSLTVETTLSDKHAYHASTTTNNRHKNGIDSYLVEKSIVMFDDEVHHLQSSPSSATVYSENRRVQTVSDSLVGIGRLARESIHTGAEVSARAPSLRGSRAFVF
jgi:hypothetical protein